jgi:hypothetical protein
MSKAALLCSAVLIVLLAYGGSAESQTQGAANPNLSSANFGWQHGLGFRLQFSPSISSRHRMWSG